MTAAGGWFHVSVKTMSRSAGRSVVAAAAYRLGEQLHEAEVDQTHDYRRRHGVAVTFTCAPSDAPDWAHQPEILWNAANAAEKRKNSTLAREVELALPASVSAEAREDIARAMSQELVDRYGVAVSGAIHDPSREGSLNHHAHILFTTRRMEPDGLGAKTRVLDAKATGPKEVSYLRAFACDLINAALEEAGSDERVDHRSFAARGIEDEPTTHLGPAGAAKERRSERSERGTVNEEIATNNQQFDNLVEDLAALDAEIAAEEQRLLDERYGEADDEPAPPDQGLPESEAPGPPPSDLSTTTTSADASVAEPLPPVVSSGPDPTSDPEPAKLGFMERAKRTLAGLFGRSTDTLPEPPEVPANSIEDLPSSVSAPDAAIVPTGIIQQGVQHPPALQLVVDQELIVTPPPNPEPLPESGERALAAFFNGATLAALRSLAESQAETQPAASPDSAPGIQSAAVSGAQEMPAAWRAPVPVDDFAQVHQATIEEVRAAGTDDFPLGPPPAGATPFDAVHNATIFQAQADMAVIDAEDANGGRFQRVQAWWGNVREHFVEWRDHFQDRVESFRSRWQEPEPPQEEIGPEL